MPDAQFLLRCVATLVIALFQAPAASAQMADNAVRVGGRVVSFLQPPLNGQVTAAILYDPGDPASVSEAAAIDRALGSGMTIGSLTLKPRKVSTNALGGLGDAKVAFVTRGINYRAIAAVTAPRSIITITSDNACVQAGYCIVAISATPKVQITVSRNARTAARLRFSAAFLMLVKEF